MWCTPACPSSAFCVICTSAHGSSSRGILLRTLRVVSGVARGFYAVLYTNEVTLWNRVLLEKPVGVHRVQPFPAFYGTQKFHYSVHKKSAVEQYPERDKSNPRFPI